MKSVLTLVLILLCIPARSKPSKRAQYQEATLVSFKDAQSGSSCASSGKLSAQTSDDGNTAGSTSGEMVCANKTVRQYTIRLGTSVYVLVYGYNFLSLHNVLASQLPGAHLLIRMDKNDFYVRIGDKEARYDIVEAH